MKLQNAKQENFFREVQELLLRSGPLSTHEIALLRGDKQVYESYLRDRLFNLAKKKLLHYTEVLNPNGGVKKRLWSLV